MSQNVSRVLSVWDSPILNPQMWDSPILKDFLSLLRFAPPSPSVEVCPTTVQGCTRSGSDTIIVKTRHKHATVLKQHLATNELPTTKLKSSSLGYLSSQVFILINLSIHMNLYDVVLVWALAPIHCIYVLCSDIDSIYIWGICFISLLFLCLYILIKRLWIAILLELPNMWFG